MTAAMNTATAKAGRILKTPSGTAGAMSAGVLALAALIIQPWEGKRNVGYADLVGVATSCWGHTGPDAIVGKRYTDAECRAQFAKDLEKHAALIRPCVPASTPVESQAAFLSLAFNVGGPAFCRSTIVKRLKAGDLAGACAGMGAWVYAGGRRVQGLVNRRNAEITLCRKGLIR